MVEQHDATHRRESLDEVSGPRKLPEHLQMRYPPDHQDDVQRTVADYLVGDVDSAGRSEFDVGDCCQPGWRLDEASGMSWSSMSGWPRGAANPEAQSGSVRCWRCRCSTISPTIIATNVTR